MKKILRRLPAKWKPKVTAIEEARDINTLSLEDLISSLKCHEIGLNEQELVRKSKFIALKSKRKSSKALKANESKDESPARGSKKIQKLKRWICSSKDFSIWLTKIRGSWEEAMVTKVQEKKIRRDASTARKLATS